METNTAKRPVQDMSTSAIERELIAFPTTMPLPISAEELNEYQRNSSRRRALRAELSQRLEDAA